MTLFAFALKAGQDVAVRGRLALGSFLAPSGYSLGGRQGIIYTGGGDMGQVTANPGSMTVTVAPFRGFIQGKSAGQGVYPVVLTAPYTVTLPAGGASDTSWQIVARVQDDSFDASGIQDVDITYVDSTVGAPFSYIGLRNVIVRAGVTAGNGGILNSDISADVRRFVAAAGGRIPVLSQLHRDGVIVEGSEVYRLDTHRVEILRGGRWYVMGVPQHGKATITPSAANTQKDLDVTFPIPFQNVPDVVLSANTGLNSTGELKLWIDASSISTTGFTASLRRDNLTPTTFTWIAVE